MPTVLNTSGVVVQGSCSAAYFWSVTAESRRLLTFDRTFGNPIATLDLRSMKTQKAGLMEILFCQEKCDFGSDPTIDISKVTNNIAMGGAYRD